MVLKQDSTREFRCCISDIIFGATCIKVVVVWFGLRMAKSDVDSRPRPATLKPSTRRDTYLLFLSIVPIQDVNSFPVQGGWGGWPTGNGNNLNSNQAQLGQATCLAIA